MSPAPQPYRNGTNIVPWIAVALSIGSAFWAVANPRDDIQRLRVDMQAQINERLTKDVHVEFASRKDRNTERLQGEIDRIRLDQVPRPEHQQHWTEQAERLAGLRDQVAEIRRDFTGSYNIGKQLENLQKQLDELRKMRNP